MIAKTGYIPPATKPPWEEELFAIIAAIIFGFALLLDLFNENLGAPDAFNFSTLTLAGLLCLALHFAGVGSGWGGRRFRGRRPGPG